MLSGWIITFRLILAAILSGAIGFEREYHGRAAGFRTHILLSLGSTLIMLTSIHMFDVYGARVPIDPARIAAGVITGIGFLGAGAIMHFKSSVRGLTTAASLWVAAGIGLAIGCGLYYGAIATTVIALVTLILFPRFERELIRKDWYRALSIEMADGMGQLKKVRELLNKYRIEITDFEVDHSDGGHVIFKLSLKLSGARYNDQIIEEIGRLEGIKSVRWDVE